ILTSRRRHTRSKRDWSSDVCSSDLHSSGISLKINFKVFHLQYRFIHHSHFLNLGSSASLKPSPTALNAKIVRQISTPGKKSRHEIGRASCRERVESHVDS